MKRSEALLLGAPFQGPEVARPLRSAHANRGLTAMLGITRLRAPTSELLTRRLPQPDYSTLVDDQTQWRAPVAPRSGQPAAAAAVKPGLLRMGRAVVPSAQKPSPAVATPLEALPLPATLTEHRVLQSPAAALSPLRPREVEAAAQQVRPMAEPFQPLDHSADSVPPSHHPVAEEAAASEAQSVSLSVQAVELQGAHEVTPPDASEPRRAFQDQADPEPAAPKPPAEGQTSPARADRVYAEPTTVSVVETSVQEAMGTRGAPRIPSPTEDASVVERIRDAAEASHERVLHVEKVFVQVSAPALPRQIQSAPASPRAASPAAVRAPQRPAFRDPWKAAFKG